MTIDRLFFNTEPDFRGEPSYTAQVPGDPPADAVSTNPAPPPAAPAPPDSSAGGAGSGGSSSSTAGAAVGVSAAPPRAPTTLPVPVVEVAPTYSAADYGAAGKALLPRGRAWSDEPGSVQGQVMTAIGKALARTDAAAGALLAGAVPGALTFMLPEWEAALGLPDPCIGDEPTIAQRLEQVRARFIGAGGQSRERYTAFAASLGFTIEIVTFKPGQANLPANGPPANSDAWMFVWGVRVTATTGLLPPAALLCELEAIKPAETTVLLLP